MVPKREKDMICRTREGGEIKIGLNYDWNKSSLIRLILCIPYWTTKRKYYRNSWSQGFYRAIILKNLYYYFRIRKGKRWKFRERFIFTVEEYKGSFLLDGLEVICFYENFNIRR